MNRISRELLSIAREIKALDEEGDGSGFQYYHDQENYEQEMFDRAQKEGKKYILHHKEGKLWRIQACKNFSHIFKGDFGGLIESENNLSQKGDCWISDNAQVYDKAKVYGNAQVYGDAIVSDFAQVHGNAKVSGISTVISDFAQVYENAQICDYSQVCANAQVCGSAVIQNSTISGMAWIDYNVKDKEITE